MNGGLRQVATTFVVVIITLIVVHVALHSNGGTVFSLSRSELIHQAITAVALTVALMLPRGGRR